MNRNIFGKRLTTSSIREMYNFLSILIPLLLLMSCEEEKNKAPIPQSSQAEVDSSVSFSIIEKDSAYTVNYKLHKKEPAKGTIVFTYSGSSNSFTLWCDTTRKIYKEITGSDTTVLEMEKEEIYEINGERFQVLKLVGNKNATDGEMLYFLEPEIGLLITKSVTWRLGEIINPDQDHIDYVRLTALLFRILTDEENFNRMSPVNKIKFTVPKIE
jgi:hypothetical protein